MRPGARSLPTATHRHTHSPRRPCTPNITGHAHEVDENGSRLVVRNGYHDERAVLKAAGAVMVRAVRVNDKRVDPASGARQRFLRRSRLRSTGKAVDTQSTEKPRSTTV